MDAFFAAVEQASKPSLRGKPVVVGGLGPRGVVSTASYEARVHGVHSAMAMAHARRLCPNAAYLVPRFAIYRQVSEIVMALLREVSPLIEPLSVDEAFVDLEAGDHAGRPPGGRRQRLRADIRAATGLTASVGLAGSKLLAKIASEQAKPDGLVRGRARHRAGAARPDAGPHPAGRRAGHRRAPAPGRHHHRRRDRRGRGGRAGPAAGQGARRVAATRWPPGVDNRPVVADRDVKSVSVEDTFDSDLTDRARVRYEIDRLAERCVQRLRGAGRSGRTVVVKVRRYDFSTLTRSETLRAPTDDPGGGPRDRPQARSSPSTPPAACGCWGSASPGSPTSPRRTCSRRRRSERAAPVEDAPPELPSAARRPAPEPGRAAGCPGQDVTHEEYGAGLGAGQRRRAGSRSASRCPPTRRPAGCAPSRWTTPRSPRRAAAAGARARRRRSRYRGSRRPGPPRPASRRRRAAATRRGRLRSSPPASSPKSPDGAGSVPDLGTSIP